MNAQRRSLLFFAVILIGYLIVGGLFAIRTPAWQAPDEPAHYNYVRQVATAGCCPVIESGDWDSAYLDALKTARFSPPLLTQLDSVQYEDHQPPLYYLLLAPVYTLTNGSLTALRLASLMIGAVIVWAAFGIGRQIYPQQPQIALTMAAFVAFMPQHLAILASVNNDALGWALVAGLLWGAIRYLQTGRGIVWLGVLMGAALVTKATAYLMAGVVILAVVLRHQRAIRPLLGDAVRFVVPALGLGALWWVRNFSVYGVPDFLGLRAHDAVVVGQPRTAALIEQIGVMNYLHVAAETTFYSFWGTFGWMALPLVGNAAVNWIYPLFLGVLLAAISGLLLLKPPAPQPRSTWLLFAATMILAALAYAYYNTEFQQFQGRYMFPLLIPLGVVLAVGIDAWRVRLVPRLTWLTPALFCLLAGLDVWLLWRVIVPNLAVIP